MGAGGAKITLNANVDSPSGGGKSVISDSIEELGLSEDKFWELLAKVRRAPLEMPGDGVAVLKHETTDLEDGSFRVLDTIGGLRWGESQVTMTHSFDKEKGLWTTVADRDPFFNKVQVTVATHVLKDPLRIELWGENAAARVSGPPLREDVAYTVSAILSKVPTEATVETKADVDSPSGGGLKSVVAGPFDDLVSPEKFWDLYDAVHREGMPLPFLTSTEVKDLDGGGFQLTQSFGHGAKIVNIFYTIDREKNEATATYYDAVSPSGPRDEDRSKMYVIKVHLNPMRLEVWLEVFPGRRADEGFKMMMQGMMDRVMELAEKEKAASEGGGGWFS